MSSETKAALETALETHFADEMDDGVLTGYIWIGVGVTNDQISEGGSAYLWDTPDNQPPHASLGLVQYLGKRTDFFFDGDDDD
jgi:hypothetical protein